LLGTSIVGYALALHLSRQPGGQVIGLRTYPQWLRGVLNGNWGAQWPWDPISPSNPSVLDIITTAIPHTLRLISGAAVFAVFLGVIAGLIGALQQHSRIDYWLAALGFILFSIPPFVAAYMMQLWGIVGINNWFNNFATNRAIPWLFISLVALVSGLFWSEIIGGRGKKRLFTFAIAAGATLAVGVGATVTGWVLRPRFGVVGVAFFSAAIALVATTLVARIGDRRTLRATLVSAATMTAAWYPLQFLFANQAIGWPMLGLVTIAAIGCGWVIGWLSGGEWKERRTSMRAAALTSLFSAFVIFLDRILAVWPHYLNLQFVANRPLPVFGRRPGIPQDFWFLTLDSWLFLLPATIALGVISFAGYMRYARSSFAEVLSQDYIRTARAKGMPEHVVLLRHALRNALIPLATIMPLDLAGLVGGAILVEFIFGIPGMGAFYRNALYLNYNMGVTFMFFNQFMAYLMVTGAVLIAANIISDLIYAALDPRIRLSPNSRPLKSKLTDT